jgi:hypothetical protein
VMGAMCVQRDLAGILRGFAERGYKVEVSKSRIIVCNKHNEKVFPSNLLNNKNNK